MPTPLPALTPLPTFSSVSHVKMPGRAFDDPLLSIPVPQRGAGCWLEDLPTHGER